MDIDPVLIEAAREDHPGATWIVSDLVDLDLAAHGETEGFDGAFIVGNVMDFVPAEHRTEVLKRVAAQLLPDAFVVVGCRTYGDFGADELDRALPEAGLTLEHRFATYDLRPWQAEAPFCVSVLRSRPGD